MRESSTLKVEKRQKVLVGKVMDFIVKTSRKEFQWGVESKWRKDAVAHHINKRKPSVIIGEDRDCNSERKSEDHTRALKKIYEHQVKESKAFVHIGKKRQTRFEDKKLKYLH